MNTHGLFETKNQDITLQSYKESIICERLAPCVGIRLDALLSGGIMNNVTGEAFQASYFAKLLYLHGLRKSITLKFPRDSTATCRNPISRRHTTMTENSIHKPYELTQFAGRES
ncbi:hypothetical protein CBL_06740 [Carabus blaptoides fortunei]